MQNEITQIFNKINNIHKILEQVVIEMKHINEKINTEPKIEPKKELKLKTKTWYVMRNNHTIYIFAKEEKNSVDYFFGIYQEVFVDQISLNPYTECKVLAFTENGESVGYLIGGEDFEREYDKNYNIVRELREIK
jgi:hypothetical protein